MRQSESDTIVVGTRLLYSRFFDTQTSAVQLNYTLVNLLQLHRKLIELIDMLLKAQISAYVVLCGAGPGGKPLTMYGCTLSCHMPISEFERGSKQ